MAASITLSAAVRTNLSSLNTTTSLAQRTQQRLATGNKVNSSLDDATAYFQAKSITDRASNFSDKKSDIDQAISSLTAASNATDSIETILKQIKGIAISARTADTATRKDLQDQASDLFKQVNNLVNDATYQGTNLLSGTVQTLTVSFSEQTASRVTITARNTLVSNIVTAALAAATDIINTILGGNFTDISTTGGTVGLSKVDDLTTAIDNAVSKVRATATNLGGNVTFLQTRLDFTTNYVDTLTTGSGKLTLADTNEEGANLVSLQTRQQLALKALSFAGQSEQSILQLFQ